MSCDGSSESPGVSSRIQQVSLDVANLVVCLWRSPAGLHVSPADSRRYHWMLRTSWYIPGCLQQVSRCLPRNPGGIIGCNECRGMSLDISSRIQKGSLDVANLVGYHGHLQQVSSISSRIQEGSMDVVHLLVCLWMSPAGVQASPAESTGTTGCCEHRGMSQDVSSQSPGVTSRIQDISLHVVNLMVCRLRSPAGL